MPRGMRRVRWGGHRVKKGPPEGLAGTPLVSHFRHFCSILEHPLRQLLFCRAKTDFFGKNRLTHPPRGGWGGTPKNPSKWGLPPGRGGPRIKALIYHFTQKGGSKVQIPPKRG